MNNFIYLSVNVWHGDAKEPSMQEYSTQETWQAVEDRVKHQAKWFAQQGFWISWAAQQGASQPGSAGYRSGIVELPLESRIIAEINCTPEQAADMVAHINGLEVSRDWDDYLPPVATDEDDDGLACLSCGCYPCICCPVCGSYPCVCNSVPDDDGSRVSVTFKGLWQIPTRVRYAVEQNMLTQLRAYAAKTLRRADGSLTYYQSIALVHKLTPRQVAQLGKTFEVRSDG